MSSLLDLWPRSDIPQQSIPGRDLPVGPSTPPAKGAVATPDPVPPPPPPPPLGGAVGQALALQDTLNDATDEKMKTGMWPQIMGQMQQVQQDYAGAQQELAPVSAEIARLATQDAPEHIPVPRLHELPPPPTIEEIAAKRGIKPEDVHNPMRVFGQFMPVLVTLGAALVAKNGIAALNAATAAMTAAEHGDDKALAEANQEWLQHTKAAVDENSQMIGEYKLALEDRNLTMTERLAKIQGLTALRNDVIGRLALGTGQLDNFVKLQQAREGAESRIAGVLGVTLEYNKGQEELALRRQALEFQNYQATHPPVTSTDEAMAKLTMKVLSGQPLTPEDEAAKGMLMSWKAASTGGTGGMAFAPGVVPGATATPAAPAAQPAAAASTGAPVLQKEAVNAKQALAMGASRDQVKAMWVSRGFPESEFDRLVR